MTVRIERSLHLRDLRLLLQGGEVHAVSKIEAPWTYDRQEVVCTIRLCSDAQRYIDRVMRKARRDAGIG